MAKKKQKEEKFISKNVLKDNENYAEVMCHQVDTLRAIAFFDENDCTIIAVVNNNNNTRTIFVKKNKE